MRISEKVRAQVSRCLAKIILGIFVFTTLCLIPAGTVETAAAQTTTKTTVASGTSTLPLYIIDMKAGPTVMIVGGVWP